MSRESGRGHAVSVGILAGGRSERMGTDKALLRLGSRTIVETIAAELRGFSEVLISAAQRGRYEFLGLPVVCDENRDIGPIEGLRRLLTAAREDHVFVCAADMPFIRREVVEYIARHIRADCDCYVITLGGRAEPLCAVYSKSVLPVIEAMIREGCYRLRELYRRCSVQYIPLETSGLDPCVVRNMNTPEDYRQLVRGVPEEDAMNGIMEESLLDWELNGIPQPPLLCTAEAEEALLRGHVITCGKVDSPAQINSIARDGSVWRVSADGAVNAGAGVLERLDALASNASGLRINSAELVRLCDQLMAMEHASGHHACLLFDGECSVVGRDIGRHNALDKAIGSALAANLRPEWTVMCSTARLTLETLVKAARAGIPILATRKSVGSLCVARAEKLNIAVCRVAQAAACYSARWRVV